MLDNKVLDVKAQMSYNSYDNLPMEPINKVVAKNLKLLRESCDMSQAEFARKCLLHRRTYNRLEQGEGFQHLEMLQQIAAKNDFEVWQLLVPTFTPGHAPIL